MPQPSKSERLAYLDVIRGVAALAVALQHACEAAFPGYRDWSVARVNFGVFGVVAFFLVSGFIIPVSLERQGSLGRFWVGRFFRLYPMYWLSLLLAGALAGLGLYALPAPASVRLFIANATMFQELLRAPHVVGVYWTLSLELCFYAACSVLFAVGLLRRTLLWAWVSTGTMLVGSAAIALALHRTLPAGRVGLLVSAFVGTVLFRVAAGELRARVLGPLLLAVGATCAFGFWLRFGYLPDADRTLEWTFQAVLTSWALAYAFVLAIFAARTARFPGVLRWLGQVSYSVYLVHPLFISALPGSHAGVLGMAWVIAATCAVSAVTYRFLELPLIALGKRVAARIGAPKVEASARPA